MMGKITNSHILFISISHSFLTMSSSGTPTFNILLVGDAGVGKTAFVSRHYTGEFVKSYIETEFVKNTHLPMYTTMCKIVFSVWDFAGSLDRENTVQYSEIDAAIIMFDVTSRETYKSVSGWYKSIRKFYPEIPVVTCGSKVDCKDRKVKPADISLYLKQHTQYYDISAKSNYNFEKPFLYIARHLMDDRNITFTEAPAVLPPEVKVSDEQIARWHSDVSQDQENWSVDSEHESDDEDECKTEVLEDDVVSIDEEIEMKDIEIVSLKRRVESLQNEVNTLRDLIKEPSKEEILDDLIEYWSANAQSTKEILERSKIEFAEKDRIVRMEQEAEEKLYCWPVIVRSPLDEYQVHAICSSEEMAVRCMRTLACEVLPGNTRGLVFINKIPKNDYTCFVYNDDESKIIARMLIENVPMSEE